MKIQGHDAQTVVIKRIDSYLQQTYYQHSLITVRCSTTNVMSKTAFSYIMLF